MKKVAVIGIFALLFAAAVSSKSPPNDRIPADEWCSSEAAEDMLKRRQRQQINIQDLETRTSGDQIVFFGHRGGYTCEEKFSATEDSIANIHKAVRMGLDGYETDIWPTADGQWVSHHDSRIGRTSAGSGEIMEHTLAELRELNLKYVKSGEKSTDRIPSLQEFLRAGGGRIIFLLQVKHGITERFPELQKIVKEVGADQNTLYWVKAYKENVDAFAKYIEMGIEDIPATVVWRVGSLDQLQDLAARIKPHMVDITLDIPSTGREEWSDETYEKYFPHDHARLVEEALKYPFIVMVSRVRTNKYMDFLYEKGLRVVASKKAEVQLQHAIRNGKHF